MQVSIVPTFHCLPQYSEDGSRALMSSQSSESGKSIYPHRNIESHQLLPENHPLSPPSRSLEEMRSRYPAVCQMHGDGD